MTLALGLLGLALGALFIWGLDYELAAMLDLDFVGAVLLLVGSVGVLGAMLAHGRRRADGSERSRQAGTSL